MTVHLADYWQDLPLSLSGASWSGGEDFIDVYGPWDIGDTVPFPALSIPVRESDDLTVALARNADGSYEINGYDFTGISSAMYFTPAAGGRHPHHSGHRSGGAAPARLGAGGLWPVVRPGADG